ncbi:hypothetical protein [Echinicola shivajiensis]|uniref:hypothetical protein n=1 Tax=Echinicola shivajiensis TaxID=1035916 RepID=UPI001BFC105F|nr:hypothetical protein [Echinicola shivajiensis]
MRTSYLDYYKLILDKVSFDSSLWKKEYHKALSILSPEEAFLLKNWVNNKYYKSNRQLTGPSENQHHGIAIKSFKPTETLQPKGQ